MKKITIISLFFLLRTTAFAQFIDASNDRVKTPLTISYKKIGTLKPRSAKDIESSRITIGCETLDRDFTNFEAYKAYLPPMGVKKIRLQFIHHDYFLSFNLFRFEKDCPI